MKEKAKNLLRTALNDRSAEFRDGQWECIEALLERNRMLVVQRTGWGKSMVYFLATRLLRDAGGGLTLLISPLLALMRNQMLATERIGIKAETINSTNIQDWDAIRAKLLDDRIDILLISPERLANQEFRENVLLNVADRAGLFVVDEAHCISDWGHDFRPDYRRIVRVLRALPSNIPVLATTATANDRVVADVAAQLGDLKVRRGPLTRQSLRLQNIWLPSPAARMAWLAENLPKMAGSGIIYTLTIRDAERVAEWLQHNHIDARAYHSGVVDRSDLEDRLLKNRIKALVSTVALGMGFDKPDLGFVIHYQRPGSIVHYYQQVGRAGRAMEKAYGILLGGHEDDDITEFFIKNAFPPQVHVDKVLDALRLAEDGHSVPMLQQQVNLRKSEIDKTLKYLSVENPSPVIKQGPRWYATPVNYDMDSAKIDQLCALRRSEQKEMHAYMQSRKCLMQFLSQALDDPRADPCGRCAVCLDRPLWPDTVKSDSANAAGLFLKRNYQTIAPRKMWPPGALPNYGFSGRIGKDLQADKGRALSLWGDAGWGQLVRRGKTNDGRFADALVEAALKMIRAWNPDPKPDGITCVPSLTSPELVSDLATRLSKGLEIPFIPCVKKVKQNRPQKEMLNSHRQAGNLDGVFEVDRDTMPSAPVLLVDDTVNSRWTITVIAALLREAGCPAVHPLALAIG